MGLHKADHVRRARLSIELFGMVSNRQMEERTKGADVARPAAKPVPRIAPRVSPPAPKRSPANYTTAAAESPVQMEKTDDKGKQEDDGTGSSYGSSGASGGAGGNVDQRQQTTGYNDGGKNAVADYIARLTRRLQANLVYPEETRKHGVEGVSWISFTITESGAIKEGTLRMRKSSGYASLDTNALNSARTSAPFERPPKELRVKIGVEFNVEMASRTKRASR